MLISCAGEDTFTLEEINGVKHVHNIGTKWGENPKVELEYIRTWGTLEGEDENHQFFRPSDINIDSDGNVYILDSGNGRVQKFTAGGDFLSSFGKKGQGPGELSFPGSIKISNNNQIYINEMGNSRISVFDNTGKFQRIFKFDASPSQIEILDSGEIAAINWNNQIEKENDGLISIFDHEGNILRAVGTIIETDDPFGKRVYNSASLTVDKEGSMYLAFIAQNRMDKYTTDGKHVMQIDRPLEYAVSSTIESKEVERDGMMLLSLDYNQISSGIQVDDKGRIWVCTRKQQVTEEDNKVLADGGKVQKQMIEIFNPDGSFLGSFIPDSLELYSRIRIIGDRFYIINQYSDMNILEYKIFEK